MALIFIAIDPDTNGDHCPALFVEEETGDLLFQGWTVTDPVVLAESGRPARWRTLKPWSGSRRGCGRSSWRRSVGTVPPFSELIAATRQLSGSPGDEGRLHARRPGLPRLEGRQAVAQPRRIPPGTTWFASTRPEEWGSAGRGSSPSRSRTTSASSTRSPAFNVAAGEEVRWLPRRRTSICACR